MLGLQVVTEINGCDDEIGVIVDSAIRCLEGTSLRFDGRRLRCEVIQSYRTRARYKENLAFKLTMVPRTRLWVRYSTYAMIRIPVFCQFCHKKTKKTLTIRMDSLILEPSGERGFFSLDHAPIAHARSKVRFLSSLLCKICAG